MKLTLLATFFIATVISQMAHIRGVGGGRGWVGSQRRVKATIKTQKAALCSVSDTNSHNPQDRPGQLLSTVWHHTHPY